MRNRRAVFQISEDLREKSLFLCLRHSLSMILCLSASVFLPPSRSLALSFFSLERTKRCLSLGSRRVVAHRPTARLDPDVCDQVWDRTRET